MIMTNLRLLVERNYSEMSKKAAHEVISLIKLKPDSSLALPTGETAKLFYKMLVKKRKKEKVSFSRVTFFQLDELVGLGHNNNKSYAHYLRKRFIGKVDFKEKNVHLFDGTGKNPEKQCKKYEKEIRKKGIDLAVLGLGNNGHIAFNEPGSPKKSVTRLVRLKKETVKVKKKNSFSPELAFSIGLSTIIDNSKRIIVIANGKNKAKAIKCSLEGRKKNDYLKCPAAILNQHKNSFLLTDSEGSSLVDMQKLGFTGKSIFRKNDIRGIVPTELDSEITEKLGRSVVHHFKAKKIVLGKDNRKSSNQLSESVKKGITDQGAKVIDIGFCTSPMNYFACRYLKADAGLMITASHNPSNYNGFKITKKGAVPISIKTGLEQIRIITENGLYEKVKKKGKKIKKNIWKEYSEYVNSFGKIGNHKIVFDTGHGMSAIEVDKVFKKNIKKVWLNKSFTKSPDKIPNPFVDPKTDLEKKVLTEKADMGVSFDYDGDRIFFVAENGLKIRSEAIASMLIEHEYCGKTIVYDVRSGRVLTETIKKYGGKGKICEAGHTKIVEKLRKENAVFCGEVSGHYYFKKNNYNDSSAITIVKVLSIMEKTGKPLSKLVEKYDKYFQSGEKNFVVKDRKKKISEIVKIFRGGKRTLVDGLRVDYKDWWFNVRESQNEPLLRLNIEAKTKKILKEKEKKMEKIIKN